MKVKRAIVVLALASCAEGPYDIEISPNAAEWAKEPNLRQRIDAIELIVKQYVTGRGSLNGWTIIFTGQEFVICGEHGLSLGCTDFNSEQIAIPTLSFSSVEESSVGHEIGHVIQGPNNHTQPPNFF